jgi:hypothetical protein
MTNIITFPGGDKKETEIPLVPQPTKPDRFFKVKKFVRLQKFLRGVLKFLWVITAMTWPITRWIVRLDLLFSFLRMLFGVTPHAGWVFLLHVAMAISLAAFVIFYRPDEALPKKQRQNYRTTGDKGKRRRH